MSIIDSLLVTSQPPRFSVSSWAESLKEIIRYWPLALLFAGRNMKLKYKQAVLGICWVVVQPAVLTVAFSLFTYRLGDSLDGQVAYRVFAMATLIGWSFFQTVVTLGSLGPLIDGGLMQRIYFPREFSVLGWSLASVLDLAILVPLFVLVAPFFGGSLSWATLCVLPLALILLILGTGVAFFMGAIMVYYRDVRYALPLLMQFWLFASPVAYPLSSVPEEWRLAMVVMNPVAGVLDGFYRTLATGIAPDLLFVTISAAESLFILIFGYTLFKFLEPNFADVV
jgi:lipopolysaccharide transport system permease protein